MSSLNILQPSLKNILTLVLVLSQFSTQAWSETSPLSALPEGIGLKVSPHSTRERGMGEAGMAAINRQGPSLINPSKTAWNEKTSFAATFESDVDYLKDNETSNRTSSFVLPMIAMNFQTRMPLNIGLFYRQLYHKNYSFVSAKPINPDVIETYSYEGGLYEVGGTIAYAPINNFSVGLGYNFILGRERNMLKTTFDNPLNPEPRVNLEGDTITIRTTGSYPTLSMTFRQKKFSLGASATLGSTLDRTLNRSISGLKFAQSNSEKFDFPSTAILGGAYKLKQNQTIVADISIDAWDSKSNGSINTAFQSAIGYELQGASGVYEQYLRKISFRGGLGFERVYLEEVDLYSFSLGAGLPLGKRGNILDFALKYGHRGFVEDNLWSEDFIKLSATLTGVGIWGQPIRKRR